MSGTAEVGIYYDNLTYSNPVQWTLVGNQGNYSAGIVQNNGSGIGWSIGGFEIQGPGLGSSTAGNFSLYQSSPQSVSGQTNYTSSVSFTVGVEAGTDGLGANALRAALTARGFGGSTITPALAELRTEEPRRLRQVDGQVQGADGADDRHPTVGFGMRHPSHADGRLGVHGGCGAAARTAAATSSLRRC